MRKKKKQRKMELVPLSDKEKEELLERVRRRLLLFTFSPPETNTLQLGRPLIPLEELIRQSIEKISEALSLFFVFQARRNSVHRHIERVPLVGVTTTPNDDRTPSSSLSEEEQRRRRCGYLPESNRQAHSKHGVREMLRSCFDDSGFLRSMEEVTEEKRKSPPAPDFNSRQDFVDSVMAQAHRTYPDFETQRQELMSPPRGRAKEGQRREQREGLFDIYFDESGFLRDPPPDFSSYPDFERQVQEMMFPTGSGINLDTSSRIPVVGESGHGTTDNNRGYNIPIPGLALTGLSFSFPMDEFSFVPVHNTSSSRSEDLHLEANMHMFEHTHRETYGQMARMIPASRSTMAESERSLIEQEEENQRRTRRRNQSKKEKEKEKPSKENNKNQQRRTDKNSRQQRQVHSYNGK